MCGQHINDPQHKPICQGDKFMSNTIYKPIRNKYFYIYHNIILKAKCQERFKGDGNYYERHHIIPKSIGGNNDEHNLVLLTAKEHFICHHLLTKIYPENDSLHYAFCMMCNMKNKINKKTK